jgi:hypothetical protein
LALLQHQCNAALLYPRWSYTPPESATIVSIPVDELREAAKIVVFQTLRIYLVIFVSRTDKIETRLFKNLLFFWSNWQPFH